MAGRLVTISNQHNSSPTSNFLFKKKVFFISKYNHQEMYIPDRQFLVILWMPGSLSGNVHFLVTLFVVSVYCLW